MTEQGRAPLFGLGAVVATPGAAEVLAKEGGNWRLNAAPLLARHQGGDWGDVPRRTPARTRGASSTDGAS